MPFVNLVDRHHMINGGICYASDIPGLLLYVDKQLVLYYNYCGFSSIEPILCLTWTQSLQAKKMQWSSVRKMVRKLCAVCVSATSLTYRFITRTFDIYSSQLQICKMSKYSSNRPIDLIHKKYLHPRIYNVIYQQTNQTVIDCNLSN